MRLNTLKPAKGAKTAPKRLGRGIGSGLGKTSGKGHKGQKARAGGYHKVGFEGGQMPIHRRLPKFGFRSRKANFNESIRLSNLVKLDADVVDFELLQASGLVGPLTQNVKIYKDREIEKKMTIKGLALTKGAKEAVEKIGGTVEE